MSSFRLDLEFAGKKHSRLILDSMWKRFGSSLQGVCESTRDLRSSDPSWSPKAQAYFDNEGSANAARKWIEREFHEVSVKVHLEQDRDWNAEWKKSFTGVKVGRFHVVPPWLASSASNQIVINPGFGFGTGTHETTQLCIEELEAVVQPLGTVLDFGSGSGVLSIAAKKLGADRVVAVENDEMANENAIENFSLNRVEIELRERLVDDRFDVVVANIVRPVLVAYKTQILSRLKPGGLMILSGLLDEDRTRIEEAFGADCQWRSKSEWFVGRWDASVKA